ncbi:MAG TPA: hypothetical protein VKR53_04745, partial [Puia sp.]|nr:hypothetical protein [Puia sp.]
QGIVWVVRNCIITLNIPYNSNDYVRLQDDHPYDKLNPEKIKIANIRASKKRTFSYGCKTSS